MTNAPPAEAEECRERIAEIDLAVSQLLTIVKDESLATLLRLRFLDLLRQLAAEQSDERVRLDELRASG